jgi:hypothetical protein
MPFVTIHFESIFNPLIVAFRPQHVRRPFKGLVQDSDGFRKFISNTNTANCACWKSLYSITVIRPLKVALLIVWDASMRYYQIQAFRHLFVCNSAKSWMPGMRIAGSFEIFISEVEAILFSNRSKTSG